MIPLVTRSYFSLMWGTNSPKALCRAAQRLGYTRLALTDTDNLYGLPAFLKACEQTGITPIIGAEITLPETPMRLVCLVKNNEGYKNLCRLLTVRKTLGDACHAPVSRNLKANGLKSSIQQQRHPHAPTIRGPSSSPARCSASPAAIAALAWLLPYTNDLLFLTSHPELLMGLHQSGAQVFGSVPRKPAGCFNRVRETASYLGRPTVAVPSSFFLQPKEHALHLLLRAIARNSSLSQLQAYDIAPSDAWLASPQEYQNRFEVFPEAVRHTHELAEQCTFTTPKTGIIFPDADLSNATRTVSTARAIGADVPRHKRRQYQMLSQQTYAGAHRRYGDDLPEVVVERIEHELRSIAQKGFIDYFLIIQDIVQKSPRICGRGSGAASIVAYCLGITNVCPIKFNLYFERFLNPGRMDPPDIDIDFAWDERDEVLANVFRQYSGQAAMVCNHVYFQPRMAIRETAKVFGIPEQELGRVGEKFNWHTEDNYNGGPTKESFPLWTQRTRGGHALGPKQVPDVANQSRSPQNISHTIIALAQQLVGIPRHLSVHPGGVVITPCALHEYVPIETATKGVPIIHWEKDGAEQMGLVKIDLLGNRSLGVIRDTIANIKAHGIHFNESRWEPEDDALTQRIVARGETMGCFYIESPGMRLLQQKTKKGDYEHLIIHSSIIRPAANEYIREYVRRVRGGAWQHFHPALADTLDETYGIMVYQEQVSQAAMALAGFDHSEADRLRKVLSKKDKEHQLADYKDRFFQAHNSET